MDKIYPTTEKILKYLYISSMDLLQTHNLDCPYCGESIQLIVDCTTTEQEYIEDCQVCCRPINVYVTIDEDNVQILVTHENE